MNQTNFEFNINSVYLRNRDLRLHYKKINEINGRKNVYLDKSENTSVKKKTIKLPIEHQFKIRKDNMYLMAKLFQISSKETTKPSTLKNSYSQDNIRHMINIKQYKKLIDKSINEENKLMFKRLQDNEPVLNVSKLEDDFQNHLRFKKLIKKVNSGVGKLYIEPTLPSLWTKVEIILFKSTLKNSNDKGRLNLVSGSVDRFNLNPQNKRYIKLFANDSKLD